jgi:hypothetical protein
MNAIVSKLIFQSVRKIAVLSFAISLVALDAQVSAEKKYPIDIKLEQWPLPTPTRPPMEW